MDILEIKKLLSKYEENEVRKYIEYVLKLSTEKKKNSTQPKNYWITKKTAKAIAWYFEQVKIDGMVIDGVNITLQSTGISYNYVAYKNKMLMVYPESLIDIDVVCKTDEFTDVKKESGKVYYTHTIVNPFERGEIIGAYCVIKNKRGEFLILLDRSEIDKHRRVAKTDFIWKQWFKEMTLKTVIKKGCKQHFSDIYEKIEAIDNENYNLDNPLDLDIKLKQEIDACTNMEGVKKVYDKYKDSTDNKAAFNKYISMKKESLNDNS